MVFSTHVSAEASVLAVHDVADVSSRMCQIGIPRPITLEFPADTAKLPDKAEAVAVILAVAAGEIEEDELARWIAVNSSQK